MHGPLECCTGPANEEMPDPCLLTMHLASPLPLPLSPLLNFTLGARGLGALRADDPGLSGFLLPALTIANNIGTQRSLVAL